MAVRTDFVIGEVLQAQDLDDTFASKPTKTTGTSAPGTPATGDIWFDTNSSPAAAKFYDGASWQSLGSAGGASIGLEAVFLLMGA